MKRLDVPLWTDTLFLGGCTALFFLCIFRFSMGLFAALAAALAAGGAAGGLYFAFMRRRRGKRRTAAAAHREAERLAFHLAMDAPEHNERRIADSLNAAREEGAEQYRPAGDGRVCGNGETYFLRFRFEKVTADALCPVCRAEGDKKYVLAGAFTDEAEKLAASFGVTLKGAEGVYDLLEAGGQLPERYIEPPAPPSGFRRALRRRVRRSAWKGYLFSGAFLLLFSLLAVFPVYYVVAGSLLLAAAVAVRFFGVRE